MINTGKNEMVGTYAIVGCEDNPNYQVWGARSDLGCSRKKKKKSKSFKEWFVENESKIEEDLYQHKLEGLKGFDGDVYVRVFNDPLDHRYVFNAYYQGNKIASFKLSGQGNYISDANVLKPFRRRGIASKVYDFVEKHLGIKLMPSPMYKTQDGEDFWKNRVN